MKTLCGSYPKWQNCLPPSQRFAGDARRRGKFVAKGEVRRPPSRTPETAPLGSFTVEREDYFMHLSKKEFLEVITRTPLVSIDLVIRDPKNRILLGFRTNEPAKNKWFVPGGRIKKGENIEEAFKRV